jgi:hypothetical protein
VAFVNFEGIAELHAACFFRGKILPIFFFHFMPLRRQQRVVENVLAPHPRNQNGRPQYSLCPVFVNLSPREKVTELKTSRSEEGLKDRRELLKIA